MLRLSLMSDAFMFNVFDDIKHKSISTNKNLDCGSCRFRRFFYSRPFEMYEEIIFMDSF